MQATVESLESEREHLTNEVKALKEDIMNVPSKEMIENMKRELRILKKLEYNAIDVETDVKISESTDESDLETVLLGKVRKLESELVKERREKLSHYQMNQDLKEEIATLKKLKEEADELALRLESDLAKAISSPSPTVPSREGSVTIAKSDPSTLEKILDPSSSKGDIPIIHAEAVVSSVSDSATEKRNDDHSVATIVMAQRDRLRARCDALEAERDSFKKELQVQVSTTESLKADNTKLYEKVRYLQSYSNSSGLQARKVDRDLDLEALESRYEASVDPFRQFNRTERQRKIKEMSPMERIVFIVARTVLGSKEMRTVLFFYVLGMHLLVFVTTYHWSHGCYSVMPSSTIDQMHAGLPELEPEAV
jgi:homeobox protein cut-like